MEEYIEDEKTLFDMEPGIVVLNHDDVNYDAFSEFKGTLNTVTYGVMGSDVKILNSKLYNKGTEATMSIQSEIETVASFIPGEITVSYMAAAVAVGVALGVETKKIIDGIANYEG